MAGVGGKAMLLSGFSPTSQSSLLPGAMVWMTGERNQGPKMHLPLVSTWEMIAVGVNLEKKRKKVEDCLVTSGHEPSYYTSTTHSNAAQ